jgi:hypothetical protein
MITNKYKLSYALIAASFAIHCILIFLPSINLEFAFADAARYFQTGEQKLVDQYFQVQANTLGLPYLSWLASLAAPGMDMLILIRLLSSAGIFLLGIGIINFCKFLKREDSCYLMALILLNPLAWVYAARATADFLPAALGVFAISLAASEHRHLSRIIFSGAFLGIAAILKYHAIFLFLILIPCLWDSKTKLFRIGALLAIPTIAGLILTVFLIIVHQYFGFWVTPPLYQSIHGINFSNFVNNLFLYIGFLILLCAPTSLFIPGLRNFLKIYKFWIVLIALLIFILGYFGFQDTGELNLGPLERFTNKNVMAGIFLILSFLFFAPLFQKSKNLRDQIFSILLTISLLLILSVFSLTRPSQRYLLIVMPFFSF